MILIFPNIKKYENEGEEMIRWLLLFINIVIIGIVFCTPHKAYGAILNPSELKNQGSIVDAQHVQPPKTLLEIDERLQNMNQAILDNQDAISATESAINRVHTDILKLEHETAVLDEKMEKRGELLKERAKAYQVTGGDLTFLNVLLDTKNISEFIDRAGTVAMIVQADHDLLKKQKDEKEEYDIKHKSLADKLGKLNSMKAEYDGMQAQILEQKKIFEDMKIQIQKQNQDHAASENLVATVTPSNSGPNTGLAVKILSISQKYIGHSVYVFGGGRTASDIQNGRFDCSGFVHWALSQVGINVGTNTDSIKIQGKQIPAQSLQPGDLVFFDTYKQDGHVGIYIGNGQFIGSQCTTGVAIADMTSGYWKAKFSGRVIRL
jgi:cell wall-associated NlpC family hydrolase